jgi:anhydro-N-acetylmuramic acid kinase
MSGTSMDGVDVALLETDGERIFSFGPTGYRPYAPSERALLRQAAAEGAALDDRTARPGAVREAEQCVTQAHFETVESYLAANQIDQCRVDVVGFHGQTILHRPERRLTVQIGDGASLAKRLRVPVVYDFRAADVEAGGQGAPLVPIYHQALIRQLDRPRPIAVLNIGGIANITYVHDDQPPIAGDTGPGNALIDDFMRARTGRSLDEDGMQAAQGTADEAFVARVLQSPFFTRPCPKSLDRNAFSLSNIELPELSIADGAATLTSLTAGAVARIIPHLPQPPRTWIVAGGGARNRALMEMLVKRLRPGSVETASSVGWSVDALEAQAFAYLAVRSVRQLPITFPTTTGVSTPLTGGILAKP